MDRIGGFEGSFLLVSSREINDNLRRFVIETGEIVEGFAGFGNDFGKHEASQHTVASGFVREDDVAGLFPANRNVMGAHGCGDVGIADWGDFGSDMVVAGPIEKTLVGHNGNSDVVEFEMVC